MTNSEEQPDEAAAAWPGDGSGDGSSDAGKPKPSRKVRVRWQVPLLAAAAVVVIGVAAAVVIHYRGDDGAASPRGRVASTGDVSRPAKSGAHTDPFDCGAATTTDQVLVEERVRVGIGGDTFCAETGGGETNLDVQHAEVPVDATGPLLALAWVGDSLWDSVVAGLADASVTGIVAVRGNEDTADPADIIRDQPLDRYDVGAGRTAFLVPDTAYTVAVVLYAGDAEVGRFPLPVAEAPGMPEEVEGYDVRADLTEIAPRPWYSWLQVDASTVRLFFAAGPAVCYGAVVTVHADADAVRIGLKTGWKPETDVCTDNLVFASVDVPLGEPLAGRPVLPLLP